MQDLITVKKISGNYISEELRASKLIPTLSYSPEDRLFICDDNAIGFCFQCNPLSYADDQAEIRITSILNLDMPVGTVMQFFLYRSPDINRDLDHILLLRNNYHHPVLDDTILERINFIRKNSITKLIASSDRGIFENSVIHDLKLIISVKVPIKDPVPTSEEIVLVKTTQEKTSSALKTANFNPVTMNANNYIRVMSTIINHAPNASWKFNDSQLWDENELICNQIFDYDTDVTVEKDTLKLGNTYVKTLSAKRMPDGMYLGDALRYIGDLSGAGNSLKSNYAVVVNVLFPEKIKTKDRIATKRNATVNQAYGPLLKFVPVLAAKKKSLDLLHESCEKNSPLKVTYTLMLFGDDKKQVVRDAVSATSYWSEMKFTLKDDKFISLPIFLNNIPLCADLAALPLLRRHKTLSAEQATVMLPIFGEWKGTGSFDAALFSRNGQLMSISNYDGTTNKNFLIAAESGAGKSFWINELITSYLSEGAKVWVIDAGKSYKNLCNMLNGDFIQFDNQTSVVMNPYQMVESYEDDEDGLISILTTMASPNNDKLSNVQISSLKKISNELWNEKGQSTLIDDVAERCLQHEDSRVKDIGIQLYAFTKKGNYGQFFSGKNTLDFKNQFTVLELDELQGRKHLRRVVLLQLINQINLSIFASGDRKTKKVVIIDEGWDLLEEGDTSAFMEAAYRKFRKYHACAGIATQSVNDLYDSPSGRAIAENSATMYLLGQTPEAIKSVKKEGRLALSDGGFRMLESVHTVPGVYSEIFVKSNAGIGVGRLIVSEFQKLLYSTNPTDINDIAFYREQGVELVDAINKVVSDRQNRLQNNFY